MDDSSKKYFGACPHDCPDTCAMVYEVSHDKLISVKGNPDHPMTRGGLCVKLKNYEARHYHPDRLLYPHKRVGKKGKNVGSLRTLLSAATAKEGGKRAILEIIE